MKILPPGLVHSSFLLAHWWYDVGLQSIARVFIQLTARGVKPFPLYRALVDRYLVRFQPTEGPSGEIAVTAMWELGALLDVEGLEGTLWEAPENGSGEREEADIMEIVGCQQFIKRWMVRWDTGWALMFRTCFTRYGTQRNYSVVSP